MELIVVPLQIGTAALHMALLALNVGRKPQHFSETKREAALNYFLRHC